MTPSTTSSKLITVAKTGRLIEMSERTMCSESGGPGRCGLRTARQCRGRLFDLCSIRQFHDSLDHDAVAGSQPLRDLDFPLAARAQLDFHALGGFLRSHAEYEGVESDLNHGDFRHDDGLAFLEK